MLQFTHLLMEAKSKYSPNIKPYLKTHEILDSVDGFSHIALNYNMLPPIRIKTRPIIFIMKRKPNIKYDPRKAKTQTYVKQLAQADAGKSTETKDVINDTVKRMEPILDEIMESLEQFERPLNVSNKYVLDAEVQEIIEPNNTENNSNEYTEAINVEVSANSSESNLSDSETLAQEEKVPNISKTENSVETENNIQLQLNIENISSTDERNEETEKVGTVKERLKGSSILQEGGSIKETVKKLIQEKLEADKLKKDMMDDGKLSENPEKINTRAKRAVPMKIEMPQKMKIIPKQEYKEKPATVRETVREHKTFNVRESIRSIINQFKEFEKDFVHEDLEIIKKEPSTEYSKQVTETSTKISEDTADVADSTTKIEPSRTIKDAKESLKDIISQFKQIKSELTSEEDDEFERIEATYMERPISETLMQFSEALKNLIQRRKKSRTLVTNKLNNNEDASKSQAPPTVMTEDSQFSAESLKTLKDQNDKGEKAINIEKLGKVTQNINAKESSNSGTNQASQEKYFTTYTNNKNVPSNAPKSTENVSNNVGKKYTSEEEDDIVIQKNVRNNISD